MLGREWEGWHGNILSQPTKPPNEDEKRVIQLWWGLSEWWETSHIYRKETHAMVGNELKRIKYVRG